MLNAEFKLFDIILPPNETKNNGLVASGCNAYIRDKSDKEGLVYSELEELSFSYLNDNDYGTYSLEFEFYLENNLKKPYHWFYASCFSVRTNNGLVVKLNGNPKMKYLSKINKEGKMVIGVGLFFRSEKEYLLFKDSTIILVEGFIAFDKYKNTYEIAVKLCKIDDKWEIVFANTYQMNSRDDIRNKVH